MAGGRVVAGLSRLCTPRRKRRASNHKKRMADLRGE